MQLCPTLCNEHIQDKFQDCTVDIDAYSLNCRQPLPHLVVGVQTVSLHKYAPHHVSNVHDKFQHCTVGVKAATMIYNNPKAYLEVCVQCMFTPTHIIAGNHFPTLCGCTNCLFALVCSSPCWQCARQVSVLYRWLR